MSPEPGSDSSRRHSKEESVLAYFGEFVLDLESGELRRRGQLVSLRPLPTQALLLLVEHGGLVSREQFRQTLWGRRFVDWQAGLHQCIRQIRRALDGEGGSTRHVETVPRRGYRLAVPVRFEALCEETDASPVSARAGRWLQVRAYAAGVATVLALPVLFVAVCALFAS